jgi:gentisate 1,2-dioxygenase
VNPDTGTALNTVTGTFVYEASIGARSAATAGTTDTFILTVSDGTATATVPGVPPPKI